MCADRLLPSKERSLSERLRSGFGGLVPLVCDEAANEIERLRAALGQIADNDVPTDYLRVIAREALSGNSPAVETTASPIEALRQTAKVDELLTTLGLTPGTFRYRMDVMTWLRSVDSSVETSKNGPPIVLCGERGPSGFICERPDGHAGRHFDGERRWPSPENGAPDHAATDANALADAHRMYEMQHGKPFTDEDSKA